MKNSGKLFVTLALISSMALGVTSCTKRGMEPTGAPGGTPEQQGMQTQSTQPTGAGPETQNQQTGGGAATQEQQQGTTKAGSQGETAKPQTQGAKTGGAAGMKGEKVKQTQGSKTGGAAGTTKRGYW